MKNFKKKLSVFLSLLIMMTMVSSFESFAASDKFILSNEDKIEIEAMLDELGIEKKVQKSLIKKLEKGELWDSMNPEKRVQVAEEYFNVSEEEPIKRYVFPDGSVIEKKLEIIYTEIAEEPEFTPFDVSGGSSSSGTGYVTRKGVKVSMTNGMMGMGFFADFTHVQNQYDYISDVYDEWVKVAGGSGSSPRLEIVKRSESANGPAEAKSTTQINWLGGIGVSGTYWLKLHVGNDTAWSSQN